MDILELVNALVVPVTELQAKLADVPAAIEETRKAAVDEYIKSLPVAPVDGQTPAPVEGAPGVDVEALKAELALAHQEIEKVKSDDESDKAAISSLQEKLAKIASILNPENVG